MRVLVTGWQHQPQQCMAEVAGIPGPGSATGERYAVAGFRRLGQAACPPSARLRREEPGISPLFPPGHDQPHSAGKTEHATSPSGGTRPQPQSYVPARQSGPPRSTGTRRSLPSTQPSSSRSCPAGVGRDERAAPVAAWCTTGQLRIVGGAGPPPLGYRVRKRCHRREEACPPGLTRGVPGGAVQATVAGRRLGHFRPATAPGFAPLCE